MKDFILPILFLCLLHYGASTQLTKNLEIYREGQTELESVQNELEQMGMSKNQKEQTLMVTQQNALKKRALMTNWAGQSEISIFEVTRAMDNLITQYSCVPSNSSNSRETLKFGSLDVPAQVFRSTIIGDFKSIMAILGELEEKYPSAMIKTLEITESNSGVSCKISIAIPYLNEIVDNA